MDRRALRRDQRSLEDKIRAIADDPKAPEGERAAARGRLEAIAARRRAEVASRQSVHTPPPRGGTPDPRGASWDIWRTPGEFSRFYQARPLSDDPPSVRDRMSDADPPPRAQTFAGWRRAWKGSEATTGTATPTEHTAESLSDEIERLTRHLDDLKAKADAAGRAFRFDFTAAAPGAPFSTRTFTTVYQLHRSDEFERKAGEAAERAGKRVEWID